MSDDRRTAFDTAPQHGPRPLPLFLSMLRSETAASPERQAAALAGLAAYQQAGRPPQPSPLPIRAQVGRARLIGEAGHGRPVVLVPSLINPPAILDLPGRSLRQWLAGRGYDAMLLDWGTPAPEQRGEDVGSHVQRYLLPLIATLESPPVLVGYCLGGTIAIAAAALGEVAGLATIAAPWRFAGYGEARKPMRTLWADARDACAALGLVPMEVLQAGFWQLDPGRTIAKFEAFGRLPPGSDAANAFVRLEDWANAGAPLPFATGVDLFERFICDDVPGRSSWRVGGSVIDPAALRCPAVEFVSTIDRIVPAATAAGLADHRELALGHVGMVVGSRAEAALWRPLGDWIDALPPGRTTRSRGATTP